MWSDRVVLIAPLLNDDPGFRQAVEDFLVEALVTQFAVEGLAIAVLPGAAGLDIERRSAKPGQPVADHLRGHLRTVVGPNVLRDTSGKHHIGHRFDDAKAVDTTSDPDCQAFTGVLIDQCHQADATAVVGLGLHEVVTPDVIAMLWPEPNARSIVEPEPASRPMFLGYFQPLTVPDPLYAITANLPAGLDQQRGDPAVAIASVLRGQSDNRSRQRIFVSSDNGRIPLRSTRLLDNPAGLPFGQTILGPNALDRPPAPFGAYKFPEATSLSTCFSSDRSATSRLSRMFSRSSSFIRFA